MRSSEQISRTVGEYHDYQSEERERILRSLLSDLKRARDTGAEWYSWIARGRPELTREEYARVRPKGARRPTRGGRNDAA